MAAALLALVSACTKYHYGSSTYGSPQEATAAMRADLAAAEQSVVPASPRLGGRAIVAVPDRTTLQANGIRVRGSTAPSADQITYLVDAMEMSFLANVDGLKRAQVFDSVTVIRASDTRGVIAGDNDFKVWLVVESIEQTQWYLARKDVGAQEPVSPDRGVDRPQRMNAFNTAVVKAGIALGAPAK